MNEWPTVVVIPWERTADVIWRDGKPRCARHPWVCLVTRYAVGLHGPGHVCAACMREHTGDAG